MKIIHTSDWHLGQNFMGKTRRNEHEKFLDWLIRSAVAEGVSVIIVAGDVFDTGAPPSYAREMYNDFVVRLQSTGVQLVVLGGNHDSVSTLSETRSLFALMGVHVIPGVSSDLEAQVIRINEMEEGGGLVVCAIPFLRPRDIVFSIAGQTGTEKQFALQEAISEHYQRVFSLAEKARAEILHATGTSPPIIMTGHLTTVGASSSDSVREIYIGSLEAFPSSGFPPADYIALGHIHRMQKVGGVEHIRYSGSPIPLSFDELNTEKTVLLVEFAEGRFAQAIPKSIPRFQEMKSIRGSIEEVERDIQSLVGAIHRQPTSEATSIWLDIEIIGGEYLEGLQQRVGPLVDGTPIEILSIRRQREVVTRGIDSHAYETLKELSPRDVFERRLEQEEWSGKELREKKSRMIGMFNDVVEELTSPGASELSNTVDHTPDYVLEDSEIHEGEMGGSERT